MKIYRIAQAGLETYTEKGIQRVKKALQYIFSGLERIHHVQAQWDRTYVLNVSIEYQDSTDVRGESWYTVSHVRDSNQIHVERYFENELMQNNYGQVKEIPFDGTNPTQTLNLIEETLREFEDE